MGPSMNTLCGLTMCLCGLCCFLIGLRYSNWRGERLLENWAASNDLVILEKENRYLSPQFGDPLNYPITLWGFGGRPVYLVSVKDKSGAVRRAWVACGHWFWGVSSDEVKVVWLREEEGKQLPLDGDWWV
jgi:hypothetical protein